MTGRTPRLRFKDSDGSEFPKWEDRRIKDVFEFLSHNTLARDNLDFEGSIGNIHYGDVLIKFPTILNAELYDAQIPKISNKCKNKTKSDLLKTGDIIMADTAEDYAVGKCIEIINNNNELVAGLHTMPFRPKLKFASGFLGYYLNSEAFHNKLIPLIVGTKVCSISKGSFIKLSIMQPSLPEQQRIASLFSALDGRICAAQRKVDALRSMKKGLLQQMFV